MALTVILLITVGGLVLLGDFVHSRTEITEGLVRNSYGNGSRKEELEVVLQKDGTKKSTELEVQISERAYTQEELKSMFQRCISRIEKEILGENQSLDCIETDMNLVTELSDLPVEISWELDRYDVMNIYGELQETELVPEGTLVRLKATITYLQDPKKQTLYECNAMIFPKTVSKEEQELADIKNLIKTEDKRTQTKEFLVLPAQINEEQLSYYPKMDSRGGVILLMAVFIGILFAALEKQNREQEEARRKAQMEVDYPEIISKLTLFIGAGMTVKRAWRKIATDYEAEKMDWGIHYAYEEMKQTCNEMDSGITEAESYERFGKRCNLQEYVKLGAMLSQNLRRGTKGLSQILKMEAEVSFEERKSRAKKLGEEAGTKMLVPMFLMLAEVLVIVVVPAFMSVQM